MTSSRAVTSTANKQVARLSPMHRPLFRRLALCACAMVLSSYLMLFVIVVSRKVDRSAEESLRRAVVADGRQRPRIIRRRTVQVCVLPAFRNPPGPVTALASFPGSGNTWIRFLVQQATGEILVNSYIYCQLIFSCLLLWSFTNSCITSTTSYFFH